MRARLHTQIQSYAMEKSGLVNSLHICGTSKILCFQLFIANSRKCFAQVIKTSTVFIQGLEKLFYQTQLDMQK